MKTAKRINLLPKSRQGELMYERIYHNMAVAVVLAVIILLSGVAAQLVAWAYLEQSGAALSEKVDTLKSQINKTENAQLKTDIRFANNQMADFEKLANAQPQWSTVFNAFADQVPDGVKITQFTADTTKLRIDVTGYSPTRDAVIQLYNNINSDKDHFHDIDYPLENVAKPTDVNFHYSFFIQSGVLVPKK